MLASSPKLDTKIFEFYNLYSGGWSWPKSTPGQPWVSAIKVKTNTDQNQHWGQPRIYTIKVKTWKSMSSMTDPMLTQVSAVPNQLTQNIFRDWVYEEKNGSAKNVGVKIRSKRF